MKVNPLVPHLVFSVGLFNVTLGLYLLVGIAWASIALGVILVLYSVALADPEPAPHNEYGVHVQTHGGEW